MNSVILISTLNPTWKYFGGDKRGGVFVYLTFNEFEFALLTQKQTLGTI